MSFMISVLGVDKMDGGSSIVACNNSAGHERRSRTIRRRTIRRKRMTAHVQMSGTDQSEVQRALKDLGTRTAANLQSFNDAVPHASWLRRSEIELLTAGLLRAAKQAPQRRQLTPLGNIKNAFSWISRARKHRDEQQSSTRSLIEESR